MSAEHYSALFIILRFAAGSHLLFRVRVCSACYEGGGDGGGCVQGRDRVRYVLANPRQVRYLTFVSCVSSCNTDITIMMVLIFMISYS